VHPSFLQKHLSAFHRIEGWFQFDAALLFMAFHQRLGAAGRTGDVLEIGVHHGLSAIAVAAMRGAGKRFVAIDLFENLQKKNVSQSGLGNRAIFEKNMGEFHADLSSIEVVARLSADVTAQELGSGFTFCHIDGGHSAGETFHDLSLCHGVTVDEGLIALDDYFNPKYPGVSEGAIEFMRRNPGALQPVAVGYNKVLFQKGGDGKDAVRYFHSVLPGVAHHKICMWEVPAILLDAPLRNYIDIHASSPERLVRLGSVGPRVLLQPAARKIRASKGSKFEVAVGIKNVSREALPYGEGVCALSWHQSGVVPKFENERIWLRDALQPGASVTLRVEMPAPEEPGEYELEFDVVWEHVMWFQDVGNPTAKISLSVEE
jgi:predicted O-methyltransferase YrrM